MTFDQLPRPGTVAGHALSNAFNALRPQMSRLSRQCPNGQATRHPGQGSGTDGTHPYKGCPGCPVPPMPSFGERELTSTPPLAVSCPSSDCIGNKPGASFSVYFGHPYSRAECDPRSRDSERTVVHSYCVSCFAIRVAAYRVHIFRNGLTVLRRLSFSYGIDTLPFCSNRHLNNSSRPLFFASVSTSGSNWVPFQARQYARVAERDIPLFVKLFKLATEH